ncbi:pheromone A receptor-domain-containing protein [Mycena galericulata]|nr:pheromone A receptor-domain-containing protein [Mycena galericulata]
MSGGQVDNGPVDDDNGEKTISARAEKRRAALVDAWEKGRSNSSSKGHPYDIIEMSGATSQHTTSYPPTRSAISGRTLSGSFLLPIAILRAFLYRRAKFAQFLSASAPSLTSTRYFRLMALSIELLLNIPLSTYGLYLSASRTTIHPWISWAYTHADFSFVGQVPAVPWRTDKHTQAIVELSRWAGVLCAFAFFAFFARRASTTLVFWALATRVGYNRLADGRLPGGHLLWRKGKSASGAPALPISLPRTPPKPRPDSLTVRMLR